VTDRKFYNEDYDDYVDRTVPRQTEVKVSQTQWNQGDCRKWLL